MKRPSDSRSITGLSQWLRLLLGLILVFGLFQWSGSALASDRGQAGLLICALVVAATITVERVLFGQSVFVTVRALGLGPPHAIGLVVAGAVSSLLLLVVFLYVRATGASFAFFPGWFSLLGGLFAQAGVAEETLFRGYLFGHLRLERTFWRAAAVSMLPFVGVQGPCNAALCHSGNCQSRGPFERFGLFVSAYLDGRECAASAAGAVRSTSTFHDEDFGREFKLIHYPCESPRSGQLGFEVQIRPISPPG